MEQKNIVLPIVTLATPKRNEASSDDEDEMHSLEKAVRKISTTPMNCSSSMGLMGLARGYEQYRESLLALKPPTEFGEASSDDLSSEWEPSEDLEMRALKSPRLRTTANLRTSLALPMPKSKLRSSSQDKSDSDGDAKTPPKYSRVRIMILKRPSKKR